MDECKCVTTGDDPTWCDACLAKAIEYFDKLELNEAGDDFVLPDNVEK